MTNKLATLPLEEMGYDHAQPDTVIFGVGDWRLTVGDVLEARMDSLRMLCATSAGEQTVPDGWKLRSWYSPSEGAYYISERTIPDRVKGSVAKELTRKETNMLVTLQRPAMFFAIGAHDAVKQKRKYSGDPYWTHPQAVAQILMEHGYGDDATIINAACLHDVLEDTGVERGAIFALFGHETGWIVDGMTKREYPGMNRAARMKAEAARLAQCGKKVKIVKLADSLHNTPDIIANDPDFARIYVPEKRHLLDTALAGADAQMCAKLDAMLRSYEEKHLTR